MNNKLKQAIQYVREHIDMEKVEFTNNLIYNEHGSIFSTDPFFLKSKIIDLMDDFSNDNELNIHWWCEFMGVEDIFDKL